MISGGFKKSAGGLPIILYEDAVRFFIGKKATNPCYACGHEMWNITTKSGICEVKQEIDSEGDLVDGFRIELECENCGLVRAHRTDPMEKWLVENPVAAAEQGAKNE